VRQPGEDGSGRRRQPVDDDGLAGRERVQRGELTALSATLAGVDPPAAQAAVRIAERTAEAG
jgi:hypothetical protein